MASLNRVILIGNLGQDPELRYIPSGTPVAQFSIATNEQWTDKSGEKKERTEWHKIVVMGKQAENCANYLRKGRRVCVEGRLRTNAWTAKDGTQRKTTEIMAQRVVFLDAKERGEGAGAEPPPPPEEDFNAETPPTGDEEDIPF